MFKQLISKSEKLEYSARKLYYSIPDYYRLGKNFRKNYNFLQASQFWTKDELTKYQLMKLRELIHHSYNTVPYYKKLFDKKGISPFDIEDFEDMKKIPYLTKEIVQNNLDDLLSNKYDKNNLQYITTGGSTGIPTGFYIDRKHDRDMEWSFVSSMWSRVGYDPKKINRTIYLRGNIPTTGIYEYKNNSLILSSYHLTEKNMKEYIDLIKKYKPHFIQAYPSSIYLLSDFLNNKKVTLRIPSLKAVLCASENLYDFQRESIQNAFNVRVYSFYGHTEHACIGGECEKSRDYHIHPEYGYTELINEFGQEVQYENEVGEIIATGFINYAMPFIRYKTADLAVNTNSICSCGRNYKLIKKIEGRQQEQIITLSGAKVAMTSIIFAQHFKAFGKIKTMQLVQNEIGKVTVKIVENEKLDGLDIDEVISKMENACNGYLKVDVEIVNNIERTSRGKHKFLIQNLSV